MFEVQLARNHPAVELYKTSMGQILMSPTDEVVAWLLDNGPSLEAIEPTQSQYNKFYNGPVDRGLIFRFRESSEAMLFKLTWK
jgi:hypothetical protein